MASISWSDFERVDIRVGRVVEVGPFPEARKPAYRLRIDFGDLGIKASSAQITDVYVPEDLVGRLVIAVVNLEPKRIAGLVSEVLVCGFLDREGRVVLAEPERDVPLGARLH